MSCISASSTITFENFQLDRRRRQLCVERKKLPLHPRALDLLEFLIDSRDRVVSHDDIMKHVWRGFTVSENNVTVQLSAVRRQLAAHGGAGLIVTVVGRGYRFAGDAVEHITPAALSPRTPPHGDENAIFSGVAFPRRKANLVGLPSFATRFAGIRLRQAMADDSEPS